MYDFEVEMKGKYPNIFFPASIYIPQIFPMILVLKWFEVSS